jgi:hypothetical protein
MPAVGQDETTDHIWDLVSYLRALSEDMRYEDSPSSVQRGGLAILLVAIFTVNLPFGVNSLKLIGVTAAGA